MDFNTIDGVRELKWAQTYFIQVLLNSFRIDRSSTSSHLNIKFCDTSSTVTRRITIEKIQDKISDFKNKAQKYQEQFDLLLIDKTIGEVNHCDDSFPFRYASGGTLPIIVENGREYYCLFYRDVFPVGWNIANGGCDSITELLAPSITITRELAEELIILSPRNRCEYVYKDEDGKIMSRPEFEIAKEQWNAFFPRLDLKHFTQQYANIEWIEGPDKITSTLTSESGMTIIKNPTFGCFLNVTAIDFSIEIDKIAKINIDNDMLLLDGEISDNKIRCRPIGLFDVDNTDKKIMKGEHLFLPDKLYYHGTPVPANDAEMEKIIIEDNITRLTDLNLRDKDHLKRVQSDENRLDLCPISSRMIRRYIAYRKDYLNRFNHKVFISHATKDGTFVQCLYNNLLDSGINCIKAPENLRCGQKVIEELFKEISESDKFIIVISENSLKSKWVQNEINEAIRIENMKNKYIILPIRIDNAIFDSEEGWAKLLLSTHIQDFRNWKDKGNFNMSLNKLLQEINYYKGS